MNSIQEGRHLAAMIPTKPPTAMKITKPDTENPRCIFGIIDMLGSLVSVEREWFGKNADGQRIDINARMALQKIDCNALSV